MSVEAILLEWAVAKASQLSCTASIASLIHRHVTPITKIPSIKGDRHPGVRLMGRKVRKVNSSRQQEKSHPDPGEHIIPGLGLINYLAGEINCLGKSIVDGIDSWEWMEWMGDRSIGPFQSMHGSVSLVKVMVQDQCPNPGDFLVIISHVRRVLELVDECWKRCILQALLDINESTYVT